jgi:hypothetical protein
MLGSAITAAIHRGLASRWCPVTNARGPSALGRRGRGASGGFLSQLRQRDACRCHLSRRPAFAQVHPVLSDPVQPQCLTSPLHHDGNDAPITRAPPWPSMSPVRPWSIRVRHGRRLLVDGALVQLRRLGGGAPVGTADRGRGGRPRTAGGTRRSGRLPPAGSGRRPHWTDSQSESFLSDSSTDLASGPRYFSVCLGQLGVIGHQVGQLVHNLVRQLRRYACPYRSILCRLASSCSRSEDSANSAHQSMRACSSISASGRAALACRSAPSTLLRHALSAD